MVTTKNARHHTALQAEVDPNDEQVHPSVGSDVIEVAIGAGQTIKIGAALSSKCRDAMVLLLKEYQDIFTWVPSNMLGINVALMTHRLVMDPRAKEALIEHQ